MSEHKEEIIVEEILTALIKLAKVGAVKELGVDPAGVKIVVAFLG